MKIFLIKPWNSRGAMGKIKTKKINKKTQR